MGVFDRFALVGAASTTYGPLGKYVRIEDGDRKFVLNPVVEASKPWESLSAVEALTYPAWYRACVLLSTAVAGMAIDVKRVTREEGGVKTEDAYDHESFWPVCVQANKEQTAAQVRGQQIWNAVQFGAHYSAIVRSAGKPIQIVPLMNHQCWPERVDGVKWFMVDPHRKSNGEAIVFERLRKLAPEDVIEVALPSYDGFYPEEPWLVGRRALHAGVAGARVRSARSVNSGRPRIALTTEKSLNDATVNRIRSEFPSIHSGLDDSVVPAILDNGLKVQSIPYQPEYEAESVLSGISTRDVSCLTGVPSSFLGDNEARSYNSFEFDVKLLFEFGVGTWLNNLEDQYRAKLFNANERKRRTMDARFDRRTTRFADTKTMAELIRALGAGAPIATINEIRGQVSLSALEQEEAKKLYFPSNMSMEGGPDNKTGDTPPGDPGGKARAAGETKTPEITAKLNPPIGGFTAADVAVTRHLAQKVGKRIENAATRKAGSDKVYMDYAGGMVAEYLPYVTEDFAVAASASSAWAGRDPSAVAAAWLAEWSGELLELAGSCKPGQLDATVAAGIGPVAAKMPGRLIEMLTGATQ